MKHYEIVYLVHPDQSDQSAAMTDRYKALIEASGGTVHRSEDWGRRLLAYPIDKVHKAHYFLMNIECNPKTLDEMTSAFRFNDAILRHLVIKRKSKVDGPSVIFQNKEDQSSRDEASSVERSVDSSKARVEAENSSSPLPNSNAETGDSDNLINASKNKDEHDSEETTNG